MSPKARTKSKGQASATPASRSPKAGVPPQERVIRPQVKRRQPSAHAAYRNGAAIQESPLGPYRVWGISRPKEKTTESRKGQRRE